MPGRNPEGSGDVPLNLRQLGAIAVALLLSVPLLYECSTQSAEYPPPPPPAVTRQVTWEINPFAQNPTPPQIPDEICTTIDEEGEGIGEALMEVGIDIYSLRKYPVQPVIKIKKIKPDGSYEEKRYPIDEVIKKSPIVHLKEKVCAEYRPKNP